MELSAAATPGFSVPLLAIGLVIALFGWVLYWGGITALGAALGAGFGVGVAGFVGGIAGWEGTGALAALVVGGVIGGIIGALSLRVFHALVFFLCGVVLGSLAVHRGLLEAHHLGWTWTEGMAVEITIRSLGALIGGVVLVLLSKFLIVIVTSTLGTVLIVGAWPTDTMLIAAVPIWAVSIGIQYFVARRLNLFRHVERRARVEEEEEED